MEPSELRQVLARLPLIAGMPKETQASVADLFAGLGESMTLTNGDVLLHEGDLGSDLGYVLLSGKVRINRDEAPELEVNAPALLGEMNQLNPRAHRTATVSAAGPGEALKFSWQNLYWQSKAVLDPAGQSALMDGIERRVWERFGEESLLDLPMLRNLSDRLRLRVCLILLWIAKREQLAEGAILFEQNGMCGATGFVLLRGKVELSVSGEWAHTLSAPNMLGVMPDFDPELQWTATATAKGSVEILKFTWLEYNAILNQRLTSAERAQFEEALATAPDEIFLH
ncbi:MAG: cyclic nucleotide-binding domain-containing protein [Nitrospiraceae bacterium]|nr:cyclic nucleotide-binding domain-containing protein [Nitrospiraceae bacterium]